MERRYETFTETEMMGETYVVAKPAAASDDRVRLDADWFDVGDAGRPPWEAPVSAILRRELDESLDVGDGVGTVPRARAVAALVETDRGDRTFATTEIEAEALLDYFAENGVVGLDGDDVVVLDSLDDASSRTMLTWAVALDACVHEVDETVDRLARATEKRQRGDADEAVVESATETYRRLAERTMSAAGVTSTGSGGLDPQASPESGLADSTDGPTATEDVGRLVEDFERVRELLATKREEVRQLAFRGEISPAETDALRELPELVGALSGDDGGTDDGLDVTDDGLDVTVDSGPR